MSPTNGLVLSIFPGIDLLGRAFEEAGYTVVRGPDPLWGGDIHTFHPPAGVFEGVIGGPPCQAFSPLRHMVKQTHGEGALGQNLIPEFERCIAEAAPAWFIMENSRFAPAPIVARYVVHSLILDNRWLGEAQQRQRRISLGTPHGARLAIDVALFESPQYEHAVTGDARSVVVKIGGSGKEKRTRAAMTRRTVGDMLTLQGFAPALLDGAPFTETAKRQLVGNGVPLPMGRAIAQAVRRATQAVEVAV